jgi:hypothetical protein
MFDWLLTRINQAWNSLKHIVQQMYHVVLSFLHMIARPFVWVARLAQQTYTLARSAWHATVAAYQRFIVAPLRWFWHATVAAYQRFIVAPLRWFWHAMVSVLHAPQSFYQHFVLRPYDRLRHWLRDLRPAARHMASVVSYFFRVTVRSIAGWSCIAVGLVLTPLPLPFGIPLTIAGIILVGPNHPIIRGARYHLKTNLRALSKKRIPGVSRLAYNVLTIERRFGKHRKKQINAHVPLTPVEMPMGNEEIKTIAEEREEETIDQVSRS